MLKDQPRDLCSNTTVRRQMKAVRAILFPVAGANSSRLMAKRRKQMLQGKLGHLAGVKARMEISKLARTSHPEWESLSALLNEPDRTTLNHYTQLWLAGTNPEKEQSSDVILPE